MCNEIQNAFAVNSIIVDANDFGVNLLGRCDELQSLSDDFLSSLIIDNPAGQSDELTPLILIKSVASECEESGNKNLTTENS